MGDVGVERLQGPLQNRRRLEPDGPSSLHPDRCAGPRVKRFARLGSLNAERAETRQGKLAGYLEVLNDRGKQIVCRLMGRPARQFKRLLNRLCNKRLRHCKLLAGSHPARYGLAIFCFDAGPTRLPINFQIILDYFVSVIRNNLARFGGAVAGATQPCPAATRHWSRCSGRIVPVWRQRDGQGVGAAIPDFDPARDGFYERGMVEEMRDQLHNPLSELVLREQDVQRLEQRNAHLEAKLKLHARHTHTNSLEELVMLHRQ
jgi:hypothetical protein